MHKLALFDTTIRDGELSPNFNPTASERFEIARALELAGVDVIELASTADEPEKLESSKTIAKSLTGIKICCISRMSEHDIALAEEFLGGTSNSRIHLYLDTKRVHAIKDGESDKQAILALVDSMVRMARNSAAEVEFSPQDATRADCASLSLLTMTALSAGAQIINISDSTGTATPEQIETLLQSLYESVPTLTSKVLSFHGHNHLGRATENALSAIDQGVRQIQGTINGVGPAGGNTDLVDVANRISRRAKRFDTTINADTQHLYRLSDLPYIKH